MLKRISLIFLTIFVSIVALTTNAAQFRPPAEKITFEQYRDLIKQKVGEVPDLQTLWSWKNEKQIKGVYFGGGAYRGLLLWINKQLATNTLAAVQRMPPPNVDGLLIQKDSDRDIYTPDNLKAGVKAWDPYKDWDVLNESFYQLTVTNAGTRLDKMRASPNWIEDPLESLPEFYRGKMSFLAQGPPFGNKNGGQVIGDSWLGLALRYIRITQDLAQVVDADPESIQTIQGLSRSKQDWIPNNSASDLTWPQSADVDEWTAFRVRKGLDKLYKATRDPVRFLKTLKKYELLSLVANKNYNVISITLADFQSLVVRSRNEGVPFSDIALLARMQVSTVDMAIALQRALFNSAVTVNEMAIALTPLRERTSEDYKNALSGLYQSFATEKPDLVGAALTPSLMTMIATSMYRVEGLVALKKTGLTRASDLTSALAFLHPSLENSNENYKAELRAVLLSELPHLIRLVQTPDDALILEREVNTVANSIEIKQSAIAKAKTAADVLAVMQSAFATPNEAYSTALLKLRAETIELFLAKRPTAVEVQKYAALLPTIAERRALFESSLNMSQSKEEFLQKAETYGPDLKAVDSATKETMISNLSQKMLQLRMTIIDSNRVRNALMNIEAKRELNSPAHTSLPENIKQCSSIFLIAS